MQGLEQSVQRGKVVYWTQSSVKRGCKLTLKRADTESVSQGGGMCVGWGGVQRRSGSVMVKIKCQSSLEKETSHSFRI
jgi:hypothetical protein